VSIKVTGNLHPFKDFAKRLDQELIPALEKSGEILKKDSRGQAPFRTGLLRSSIDWMVSKIPIGLRLKFGSGVRSIIASYAKYQEYGTDRITAVRYLRGPLNDKKQKIDRLITAAVKRAFKF